MNEQEFLNWLAKTKSSQHHWVEDEIYRLNGHGAMYYKGGEDGIYMQIDKDGLLTAGKYEGAYPHIGEATFKVEVRKQFESYNAAFTAAAGAGGKKFIADMFTTNNFEDYLQSAKEELNMSSTHEKRSHYDTGAEFWKDTAASYGLEEAAGICGRYLSMQIKTVDSEERQFCRELFFAMMEDISVRTDPEKLVYPFSLEKANERIEASLFYEHSARNANCAQAIDTEINASCYESNHYNLEFAAMSVIQEYGFSRVNAVLAHNLQTHDWDGRYSRANREWAAGFTLPDKAFDNSYMNAHPILLEGFTKHARALYDNLGAERFALPGREESGEDVHGYAIVRAITFDDRRGFAIGHNPNAADPFVAWQFTAENGKRDYYWGRYSSDMAGAADNYVARVMVHMQDGQAKEIENPLAPVEMSTEQNHNMIDGLRNNMASPKADLTDGQTHEEIRELAPETLPGEKLSVLEQIREARKNLAPPSPKAELHRSAPELEL